MRTRKFWAYGLAAFLLGCNTRPAAPPPIDVAKARQDSETEYKNAIAEVDADSKLTAQEKAQIKSQLEHDMKMRSREIETLGALQRGETTPADGTGNR
jgi:hypothetical protein